MTTTFCDSGAVVLKAGKNAVQLSEAQYTQLINQAESAINNQLRVDVVAGYAGYSDANKKILEDAASSHAALAVITYDQTGYFLGEATNLLNFNYTRYTDAIKILKEKYTSDFLEGN